VAWPAALLPARRVCVWERGGGGSSVRPGGDLPSRRRPRWPPQRSAPVGSRSHGTHLADRIPLRRNRITAAPLRPSGGTRSPPTRGSADRGGSGVSGRGGGVEETIFCGQRGVAWRGVACLVGRRKGGRDGGSASRRAMLLASLLGGMGMWDHGILCAALCSGSARNVSVLRLHTFGFFSLFWLEKTRVIRWGSKGACASLCPSWLP
jgi:hypothetical protein